MERELLKEARTMDLGRDSVAVEDMIAWKLRKAEKDQMRMMSHNNIAVSELFPVSYTS